MYLLTGLDSPPEPVQGTRASLIPTWSLLSSSSLLLSWYHLAKPWLAIVNIVSPVLHVGRRTSPSSRRFEGLGPDQNLQFHAFVSASAIVVFSFCFFFLVLVLVLPRLPDQEVSRQLLRRAAHLTLTLIDRPTPPFFAPLQRHRALEYPYRKSIFEVSPLRRITSTRPTKSRTNLRYLDGTSHPKAATHRHRCPGSISCFSSLCVGWLPSRPRAHHRAPSIRRYSPDVYASFCRAPGTSRTACRPLPSSSSHDTTFLGRSFAHRPSCCRRNVHDPRKIPSHLLEICRDDVPLRGRIARHGCRHGGLLGEPHGR